ncbi:MAG: biotin transporter BioY [Alphaproteobacteria bacterium]|nr:biotin transporter BioY [Alphaproteobacteria bacterium]
MSPVASPAASPTLIDALWPVRGEGAARLVRMAAIALLGSLLLAASARVQVPFWPVPMTMQSFVVVLIGAACGLRLGVATVLLYLAEGAVGLPVFAGTPERGIGLAYMAGPTGGFLAGFVAAAAVAGFLAERGWGRSVAGALSLAFLANAALFACGLAWLATMIGPERAFAAGFLPFALATAVKIGLNAAAMLAMQPIAERARR